MMIITETEKILDRACIFSISAESKLGEFLTLNDITAIVRIRPNQTGGFALFNFDIESVDERVLQGWENGNGELNYDNECVTIKHDLTGTKYIQLFKDINKVSSAIIDCIIFNKGYFYLYVRFHSNDEEKLGEVVRKELTKFPKFSIKYLGQNNGLVGAYKDMSDVLTLRYVEIKSEIPKNYMDILKDPVISSFGISWLREMKYLTEDEIRGVFYDKESILKKKGTFINEISPKQNIYETSFRNPIIEYIVRETSERSIVTLGMMQKLDGRIFTFATIVPDIVLPKFFDVVFQICDKFPDWKLNIQEVDLLDSMET
ncbi:MAG: hypothetical protein M1431_05370 [Candidatus Thermoplasmatota archaeon]|nr:hypothetical protein [Candidatus Thermoplasmatota archaeon]